MHTFILGLVAALFPSVASSEAAWRVDRMGPGSVLVLEDSSGIVTHVKRSAGPEGHVFDSFEGEGRDASYIGTFVVNESGNLTAQIAADRVVTRFVPHRCNRTLGRCDFVVVHPDGFQEPRFRVTDLNGTRLAYREFGLDGLLLEGQVDLAEGGIARSGWNKGKHDQRKSRSTLLRADLR